MNTRQTDSRRTGAALPAFAFALLAVTAVVAGFPCQLLPAPAARFFAYLSVPESTGAAVGVWERLAASAVLASAPPAILCSHKS